MFSSRFSVAKGGLGHWPPLVRKPVITVSTAFWTSTSSKITSADLPPSSSMFCASLGAHACMIFDPVADEPVKETMATC